MDQPNMIVLELGCGAGFNLRKLAVAQPANQFFGVDLTPSHTRQSRHAVRKYPNATVTNADFHYLPFTDELFNILYDVESVCHSDNIGNVLAEAWRVLKSGGSFILFDGFRVVPSAKLTEDEYLARRLIEKSMAIDEAILISDFLDEARRQDFIVEECTDLASQIMPNLKRLRQILTVWRSIPGLFDVSCLLLPREMAQNAIAALLMPSMVGQGYQGYYRIILQKT
ncbi:MAG: class I SAM-dependent methyltransferase, partial [Anaerolineae bacterium]|nr:class I SAM-dependent methyltransferase [Anaerolineae bacterium]